MSERSETMAMAMLLAADAPAARDRMFELEVMARLEQRRFAGTVARNLGLAVVAVLVLASLAPWIEPLPALMASWTQAPTDTLMMAILILSAALALWQAKLARDG